MLQAACSTKIHAYKVPELQKQGDAEKTTVATRITIVDDYGSDNNAHQGDTGKAAMQGDKEADSNEDEMT